MSLYLSTWFAFLASLGIQSALVLVAWLIGFTRNRRGLLVAVYAITAIVSIGFSYVSLYTWFSARERPLQVERKLYDTLNEASDRVQQSLAGAIAEGQKHVLALDEMTAAEKAHGYISRAEDADPYLAGVREAVAREARTYSANYAEGTGEGLRYTAFDRYARMTRQAVGRLQQAEQSAVEFRARLKPAEPSEQMLREFRQMYDAVPWSDVEQQAHAARLQKPAVPDYADFVDRSSSGQEDLLIAFQELVTSPGGRHVFSFLLAAFIDVVVFLLAYSAGPFFFGGDAQRWIAGGAAVESLDNQVFVRDFLRKVQPGERGMPEVEAASLTPGEQQMCLLMAARGLMVAGGEPGRTTYLLSPELHEELLASLASRGFRLHASTPRVATG